MKRLLILLAILSVLILTAGCGADGSDGAAVSAPQTAIQSMEVSATENSEAPLTEDQVLEAYDRAASAYAWFQTEMLPVSGSTVIAEGKLYQKVDYAGIRTAEELRNYLRSLFSEEIVTRLMSTGDPVIFRDVGGSLYELGERSLPSGSRGEMTASVQREDGARYTVNTTEELLGQDGKSVIGVECNSFVYEETNGRWVFTDFSMAG